MEAYHTLTLSLVSVSNVTRNVFLVQRQTDRQKEEFKLKELLTLIVDLTIAVNVSLADHFVHLLISELLP